MGGVEDLAIKGAAPDDRSLYDIIKGRIAHVHSTGNVNTPRKPLKWGTADPGGPKFPNMSATLPRNLLERLGFSYTWRGALIAAALRKPYVSNRRKAYFERRASRWICLSE